MYHITYFYPRSPYGERLYDTYAKVLRVNISIHALLTESDQSRPAYLPAYFLFLSTLSLRRATTAAPGITACHINFYPRSPYGERHCFEGLLNRCSRFLSTLSLRRATKPCKQLHKLSMHFYPRSPYGERPERCRMLDLFIVFLSTLSLRRATGLHGLQGLFASFLSTLSLRRATSGRPETRRFCVISIHALLTESDWKKNSLQKRCLHFYPRSPYGERQETAPEEVENYEISIHALLTESDHSCILWPSRVGYFYPRSPYGERP